MLFSLGHASYAFLSFKCTIKLAVSVPLMCCELKLKIEKYADFDFVKNAHNDRVCIDWDGSSAYVDDDILGAKLDKNEAYDLLDDSVRADKDDSNVEEEDCGKDNVLDESAELHVGFI